MSVKVFARDEFAAKRRKAQDDGEAYLMQSVKAALERYGKKSWAAPVVTKAAELWVQSFEDESGEHFTASRDGKALRDFKTGIDKALAKTASPGPDSAGRIAAWLATAAINNAVIQATVVDEAELELEWVTMHDNAVRTTHREADGQRHLAGDRFKVGDSKLLYPGDPAGDPEEIINCRCALRPDTISESNGETMTAAVDAPAEDEVMPAPTIPWFGVLAPEGKPSGDGRQFAPGALRNRDLPLPLTWQKASSDGHSGSVVVGKIEQLARSQDGLIMAQGTFMQSPEADEVVGLIAEFGKFGVSVDVDDAQFELDEEGQSVTFTSARISSAAIVPIPAFAEAYVALGQWSLEGNEGVEWNMAGINEFGRGPGWVTNPGPTKRLHDYWTVPGEPGYEKIGWGTGGDFNRCVTMVGEEVGENSPEKLRFIKQQCAQWHHDALGYWPSTHKKMLDGHASQSVSLVSAGGWCAPSEWFCDPKLDKPTNTVVEQDQHGIYRTYGHIAAWGVCHMGFPNACITAPQSKTDYSLFKLGTYETTDGPIAVGTLSLGGGHADTRLGVRPTIAHYDSTSTAVAYVNVGEDEHGIWFAGILAPGVSEEDVVKFRAAKLSGDWRDWNGNLELVAALAVNVPGFPIERPQARVASGVQTALIAAGIITNEPDNTLRELAQLVAKEITAQQKRDARRAELVARVNGDPKERMAKLARRMEGDV